MASILTAGMVLGVAGEVGRLEFQRPDYHWVETILLGSIALPAKVGLVFFHAVHVYFCLADEECRVGCVNAFAWPLRMRYCQGDSPKRMLLRKVFLCIPASPSTAISFPSEREPLALQNFAMSPTRVCGMYATPIGRGR